MSNVIRLADYMHDWRHTNGLRSAVMEVNDDGSVDYLCRVLETHSDGSQWLTTVTVFTEPDEAIDWVDGLR